MIPLVAMRHIPLSSLTWEITYRLMQFKIGSTKRMLTVVQKLRRPVIHLRNTQRRTRSSHRKELLSLAFAMPLPSTMAFQRVLETSSTLLRHL